MKNQGFTLIEMMITVAISAILLGIAVPNFRDLIVNNRIGTQASDLITDLALARSEAVKRGIKVSMCTSTNGTACTNSSWGAGRMIFTDTGTAGSLDGADTILRVSGTMSGGLSLASTPLGVAQYVQYLPTGQITSSGTFTLCKTGYTGRIINISNTGRVSSQKTAAACP